MGENLTQEQKIILDRVKQESFLTSKYYFTGRTALSSIYLNHRYSDDLDFFSEEKFDSQAIFNLINSWSKELEFSFKTRLTEVVYIFELEFEGGNKLKVDFGHYPYKRVKAGNKLGLLEIDSEFDIAINKLLTISQRSDVKDFVDLYFLLKKYSLWDLVEGRKVKFRMKTEPIILAMDFLKVEDFNELPQMIKPLKLEQLKSFFRKEAKKISRQSIE